ncbi:MAG TPA: replication initiation factor domain-containing protein [Noviherbaspirillum sp.]|jgi:phage replication initiation protein|uniref:replication initiation factor domain-containing protein n=1 Tax=Noviherbaspirillum sp. TaxID=1926288 RepID=UPI002F923A57
MSAGHAPQRSAAGAGAAGSPRTVIRGESPSAKGAIVDYLRFTFLPVGSLSDALEQLQRYMRMWFPVPVNFIPADKGLFGYESSYDVKIWANGEMIRVAIIALGGSTAGNTMCLDMSGKGCALVEDWQAVYSTMQDLDARITRADTALDLMEGFTVEQFDDMYFRGEFNCGGRIPSRRFFEAGDARSRSCYGKTLYLGKKANGKELCIYEKGKQLGNAESEWVRIEIRFGNRDRVIPHDIVLNPTKYFAGGFLALEQLVDALPEKVLTTKKEIAEEERGIVLRRLNHFLQAAYGKTIYQLAEECEHDYQALFESIHVKGVPARLERSAVAGGVKQAHAPA